MAKVRAVIRAGRRGEDGFALVAALLAVMIFALVAYSVLAEDRGALSDIQAQMSRARLEAAGEAGLATAIAGLAGPETSRWPVGRSRTLTIDGVTMAIVIEDERGKLSAPDLKRDQARRLLQAAGVTGERLDVLTDNLIQWQAGVSQKKEVAMAYAAAGTRSRDGAAQTIGELALVQGMPPDVLARITPALTMFNEHANTDTKIAASPLVAAAMVEDGQDTPDTIIRAREAAGQTTKLTGSQGSYIGHPLTVRVIARNADGAVFSRATIVELTGMPRQPFWIRAID